MDELKKYTQKTTKDKLILGLSAVVFAIAACVLFVKQSRLLSVVMLLGAAALFTGAVTAASGDRKFFERIESSPDRNAILADFAAARSFADDEIRMGEKYVFFRKLTELIGYDEISRLRYFEHHDPETQKAEPGIAMLLANGKSRTLCSLYGGDPQVQAQEIFRFVLSRNPNVEIRQ